MTAFNGPGVHALIRAKFRSVKAFAEAMSVDRPRPLGSRSVWAWIRAESYKPGWRPAAPDAHDLARATDLLGVDVGAFFHQVTSPSRSPA